MSNQTTRSIALIGFSGSGKSTIAPYLAKRLDLPVIDLDGEIEEHCRMSITDIFDTRGEEYFRSIETQLLFSLLAETNPRIIALGGGAVINKSNWRLIKQKALTVYLKCSQTVLYERLKKNKNRPLLNSNSAVSMTEIKENIRLLFAKRKAIYEKADIIVPCSRLSRHQTVKKIADKLTSYGYC